MNVETIFISSLVIVPVVIILGGMFLIKRNAPEAENIAGVFNTEFQRISKLSTDDLIALCKKEPLMELAYKNLRYIRHLTMDKQNVHTMVFRVTVQGTRNKSVEEHRIFSREHDNEL